MPVISLTVWGIGKLSQRSKPRYHYFQSFAPPKTDEEVRTVAQYQVKDPMLAISDQSGGKRTTVTIPVGLCFMILPRPLRPYSGWLACTGKGGTTQYRSMT